MFLVNSRFSLFIVIPSSKILYSIHQTRHTLSRSYGVKLQSSLARILSSTLGFSPHPPESVCGTVTIITPYEVFLGSLGLTSSYHPFEINSSSPLEVNDSPDLPRLSLYRFKLRSNTEMVYPSSSPRRSTSV